LLLVNPVKEASKSAISRSNISTGNLKATAQDGRDVTVPHQTPDGNEAVLALRFVASLSWHAGAVLERSTESQRTSLPHRHTLLRELLNNEIKLVISRIFVKLTKMSYTSDQQIVISCAVWVQSP
jgi:hypothetical protein